MFTALFESLSAITFPHGYCLNWQTGLLALHVISNAVIALSYIAIPITIYVFVRHKHQYLIGKHLFWMFAAFIIACAMTHTMDIVVIWKPSYWQQGFTLAITALISLATAIELARQIPKLLQLPTVSQLQAVNQQLAEQIAQREKLEKKLLLTQFSIDIAGEGIYWIRPDASLAYANQAASKMLGYELDEFLKLKFPDINPSHRHEFWTAHWQQLKKQKNLKFETPIRKKDGQFITVAITANFVEYEGEEYNCAFVRDITEQKQAEQYLRDTLALLIETENQNRLILNSTSEGIYGVDQQGRATFVNQAACDMLGYSADEIQHQDMHALIHHSYSDGSPYPVEQCPMYLAFTQGKNSTISDDVLWRKDGSCFLVEYTSSPIIDKNKVIGAVIVFSDITERQSTEQRLNDLLDLNQKIISQSPVGIKVFSGSGQCVTCNEAAAQTLNESVAEILQENFYTLSFWQTTHLLDNALKCLQEKQPQRHEIHSTLANGKEVWLDYHFATFSSNREPHLLVQILDVTEYRQTEIALRKAEKKAIQANQAKSEFLANMSHEIRTPMNAILGFSAILKDLVIHPTQKYYLEAIERSGKTLLQLINDILDLSKVEAGKLTLQYKPASLKTLLNDIHIVFAQKILDKSLEFSITLADDLPDYLLLDEIRLRQILLNLVGNAVKFTQKGFINISVVGHLHHAEQQVNLVIKVCDSGIGIPKDQQEKIFEAFTQQDNQNVMYGGTGLGLTICKRLLELMNGTITVSSEVGKGSCFTLTLNNIKVVSFAAKPETVELPKLPQQHFHFQPARVLLVEDLLFNRQLIQSYLEDFPELTLVEAEDGVQALTLVNQQPFDLILMDRRLPGENGDEVCRKIKALPDYNRVPIIMITASVLTLTEQQFPIAYDKQLDKPVQKQDLLTAMQAFLPWYEQPETAQQLPTAPVSSEIPKMTEENLAKLRELLINNYQAEIATLTSSSVFQIDRFIEIAAELLHIAKQHQCQPLADWATALKNHAELFDLENLPKTLNRFDALLQQLQH